MGVGEADSRHRRGVGLLALLALGAAACQSTPPKPTDVIVVVVDTLRADRLGRYGNGRGLTPVLDRFADRGVRFANAYAPASWTMPSVASLFTSRLPSQHLVSDFDSRLPDSEVTLAERLSAAGIATAGFTANWRLSTDLGYAQGFPTWRGFLNSPGSEKKARGEVVRAASLEWVDQKPAEGAPRPPRYLYLQYMEPHPPFEPPADLRARFAPDVSVDEAARLNNWALMLHPGREPVGPEGVARLSALYDGEVAAMDAELGRLFEALEQRGVLEHALVIVTADHGEEILEHGSFGHGFNLFNTTVHVPLIVAGPGIPVGRVVEENVSLIDLAPTILDVLGLPPEPRFEGRSLLPLLRGAAPAAAPPVDILLQLPAKGGDLDLRLHRDGLVRGPEKLLVGIDDVGQRYDLAADPGERHPADIPADAPLRAALDAANAALATRQQPAAQKAVVDDATKEKLRALGYQAD
jgi:arylsulfatase A-like enzyme